MGEERADLEAADASAHQEEEVAGSLLGAVFDRIQSMWTCVKTTPSRKQLLVNTCKGSLQDFKNPHLYIICLKYY